MYILGLSFNSFLLTSSQSFSHIKKYFFLNKINNLKIIFHQIYLNKKLIIIIHNNN